MNGNKWLVFLLLLHPIGRASVAVELSAVAKTLGTRPAACSAQPSLSIRSQSTLPQGDVVFRGSVVSCRSEVPVILALPKNATSSTPLVIALHQTTNVGKEEVMGFGGKVSLAFGRQFLDAGFVVVAPDIFLAGENYRPDVGWSTSQFYSRFPMWSAMDRMLTDHQAVLSAVLNERYPSCIVAVGYSLGGHNALFLGAFDKRVDVVVSANGFEEISTDRRAFRWARDTGFIYIPSLRPYISTPVPHSMPWDFSDLIGIIGGERVLLLQGFDDPTWTDPSSIIEAAKISHANVMEFPGGHDFPAEAQSFAVMFAKTQCSAVRHRDEKAP